MKKPKQKACKECGKLFWPRNTLQKECSYACNNKAQAAKPTKRVKRIKPISDKKAEELSIYRPIRDDYLKEHTECEVNDCKNNSTHIHHKNGRNGKMLYDTDYFMAVCNKCHPQKIHENPEWSRSMGYLI